ncbi:MAG: hypothetical protein OEV43_09720, partial [Coriobacteriia bacterium]|nr:hypothetical protein [Coriobacteriia bacterium]
TYRGGHLATLSVPAAEGVPAAYPIDVASLSDGNLAVVDTASNRVVVLDPEDPFADVRVLGGEEDAPKQPTAVTATNGSLFVADAGDKLIKEYREDGTFVRSFGKRLDPRLTFVGGLHANEGMLYVSDSNASRVLVLDLETGRLKTTVQERLGLPRGVTTDDAGRVYVAEEFDAQVAVFDPTGFTLMDVVGDIRTEGLEAGGALSIPDDAFWDSGGQHLYVTDSAQGRVKVYNVRREP